MSKINTNEFINVLVYGDPRRGDTRYNQDDLDYVDSLSKTQQQLMEDYIMEFSTIPVPQLQAEGFKVEREIQLFVVQGSKTTVAHASIKINDDGKMEHIELAGEAYKHPSDKNDPYVGELLASARALRKLAKALERRAVGRTKFHDNARRAKRNAEHAKRVQELQEEHSDLVADLESKGGKRAWNEGGPVTKFGITRGGRDGNL